MNGEDHEEGCRLCVELTSFPDSLFATTYQGIVRDSSLVHGRLVRAMLPIGPLLDGHVLVASRRHHWSFGHVEDDARDEAAELVEQIRGALSSHLTSSRVVVFEHGPMSNTNLGGCCLAHAHLNVVAIPRELAILAPASKFFGFVETPFHDLKRFVAKGQPYLYFNCEIEGSYAATAPVGSTQFFRKLLAAEAGVSEWDWRSNPRPDVVRKLASVFGR